MSKGVSSALVLHARLGGPRGLNTLLAQSEKRLFRYCLRLTGHRDTAQDLCQSTLARMLERLATLREPDVFWPWVYSLARNLFFTQARQPRVPEEETRELRLQVRSALALMEPDDRAAVLLAHVEERSYGEVAVVLGESENAAKARILRARKIFLALFNR